jgi:hypothetical protein
MCIALENPAARNADSVSAEVAAPVAGNEKKSLSPTELTSIFRDVISGASAA